MGITKRKQTEETLRESEERYRSIFENAVEGFFMSTPEGRFIKVNPAFARMLGYASPYELISSISDISAQYFVDHRDRIRYQKLLQKNGSVKDFEVHVKRKDGSHIWVSSSARTIYDQNGMIVLYEGNDIDITERKREEDRIKWLNRLMEDLLGSNSLAEKMKRITDGVVNILDADFARIWITEQGDMCDSGCMHAKVSEGSHACRYRDRCLHLMASSGRYTHLNGAHGRVPFGCYKIGLVAAGEETGFLTNDVTNDQRIHNHSWARELGLVSFAGYRLLSQEELPIGVLALFSKHAISPREDALLQTVAGATSEVIIACKSMDALRESEKKYKSLTNNLNIGIYRNTLVPKGRFIEANYALMKIFGFDSRAELFKTNISDLYRNPSDRDKIVSKILKEGEVRNEELRMQKVDGTPFIGSVSAVVVKDKKGEAKYLDGIIEDISERRQTEEALRKSEEKLLRFSKMESLGLLAGGVAHDLNNVLSGIVSYPELLLMDLPEDSKFRKPIETIQESGYRAAAIVQDLLTIARGAATTKKPLNLNDLVGDYLNSPEHKKLEQFHPTVTINTDLDPDLFNIGGSYVHIRKVIMNLVSNASESIKGSGNITISTMNRYIDRPMQGYNDVDTGEYAVLSVSDEGLGISSDDFERIFEPFYSKKVMGKSGTGLGLAVVWNTVQDHKGYIDVISNENGTTMGCYFPITREEISDKDLSIPIEDIQGNGKTILVVDDVETQRDISCKMLETLGYKANAVSSGKEAVGYLKEHSVDLILLDMIMDPGINGRETYERIIKIHPNQKAIIVSGFAETDEVKEAQKLGAGKYIKKPFTLENIGIAIKEELEK